MSRNIVTLKRMTSGSLLEQSVGIRLVIPKESLLVLLAKGGVGGVDSESSEEDVSYSLSLWSL